MSRAAPLENPDAGVMRLLRLKRKRYTMKTSLRFLLCATAVLTQLNLPGCGHEQKPQTRTDHMSTKTFWLHGPAGRLFVDQGGTGGTPVVIVHSLAGNTTQWTPQLEHLRRTRRAIAFDLRGHGQSDPAPNEDYSLAAIASDLAALVDSLGLEKFILLGHSYGGGVIATYAGMHPERVAALLFIDAIGDTRNAPREQIEAFMSAMRSEAYSEMVEGHWRRILVHADSVVTNAVLLSLRRTPKAAIVSALENIFKYDPATTLQNYHGRVHAIVSGLPDDPSALHHHIPQMTHVMMPNTSHWLQMDQPEQFNRLVDEFLNRVEGKQ
jgi:pimeloyl-ACP methyl ester carboxylesterase